MIIPYQVDVPLFRWPVANFVLIGLTVAAFGLELTASSVESLEPYILGHGATGWLGHLWLHAGLFHLVGNMLFLWLFGNAVCAKVGNVLHPILYLGFGLVAATVHMIFDGAPAIGASGAINGMVGLFLVLFPLNSITCIYFFIVAFGTFSVSSYWMILLWLVYDIWGAMTGGGGIAYYAHLGGFAAGFTVGVVLLLLKRIHMEPSERSLLQLMGFATAGAGAPADAAPPVPVEPATGTPPLPDATPAAEAPIRFDCACGRTIRAPRHLAGRQAKCPQCAAPVRIPRPPV